jgi:hypothetical protein
MNSEWNRQFGRPVTTGWTVSKRADRPYSVSGKLFTGAGSTYVLHKLEDVVYAHQEWKARAQNSLGAVRVVNDRLGPGEVDLISSCLEGWTLSGSVDSEQLTDEEVWEELTWLAIVVCERLQLVSVGIIFAGQIRNFTRD